MNNLRFLIKFGEREYMERFAAGYMYFSHASKFRDYENKLKIKGQGDRLEGASRLYAQKVTIQSHENPEMTWTTNMADIITSYEPANNIPVFCLFSCFEKDCAKTSDGKYRITLNDEIKNDIREHFGKADTAVIVENPLVFINDVHTAFNNTCKTELVNYFHVEGFPIGDGSRSLDLEYFKYLAQDTPPMKIDKGTQYSFGADFVYRALFCKDVFFAKEQEYRVLLPEQQIIVPQEFAVDYKNAKLRIVSIDEIYCDNILIG